MCPLSLRLAPFGGFFLAVVFAAAAPACAPEEERESAPVASAEDVEEGMTMERVLELWGTPNVRVREEGGGERWSYWFRDTRQQVVGKAYVWFDPRRRVTEVRRTPEQRPSRDKTPPAPVTLAPAARPSTQEAS